MERDHIATRGSLRTLSITRLHTVHQAVERSSGTCLEHFPRQRARLQAAQAALHDALPTCVCTLVTDYAFDADLWLYLFTRFSRHLGTVYQRLLHHDAEWRFFWLHLGEDRLLLKGTLYPVGADQPLAQGELACSLEELYETTQVGGQLPHALLARWSTTWLWSWTLMPDLLCPGFRITLPRLAWLTIESLRREAAGCDVWGLSGDIAEDQVLFELFRTEGEARLARRTFPLRECVMGRLTCPACQLRNAREDVPRATGEQSEWVCGLIEWLDDEWLRKRSLHVWRSTALQLYVGRQGQTLSPASNVKETRFRCPRCAALAS